MSGAWESILQRVDQTVKERRMALCYGISNVGLLCPAARSTRLMDSRSSSLNLTVKPNWRDGSSSQMQQAALEPRTFVAQGSSPAQSINYEREMSQMDFVDHVPVGYKGAGPSRSLPSQRNGGKFWRRFPGQEQGSQDVTVPAEALRTGAVFEGTVSSVVQFGAFVRFGAYADGLIHISRLSTDYVKDVSDVVQLGQEVMVRIIKVEQATGRISLALVRKEEIDLKKPYVPPRREAARKFGDKSRFEAGSMVEKEERVPRASPASSSRSTGSRPRKEGSGGMPGEERLRVSKILNASAEEIERVTNGKFFQSKMDGEQGRVSRTPYASSRPQRESRRAGAEPRFQQGSSHRSPSVVEEKEKAEGVSRNLSASSKQRVAREDGRSPRFQQANHVNFASSTRETLIVRERRVEKNMKPKMKLVQIRSDENEDNSGSSRMRSEMRNWFECECCF